MQSHRRAILLPVASLAVFFGGCTSTARRPLLFQATMPGDAEDIFTMDVATGKIRRITQGHRDFANSFPTWSPDGKQIAFVRQSRTQPDALFVLQAWRATLRQLRTPQLATLGTPAWSPDGKEILISAGENRRRRRLYRVRADGSGFSELTLSPGTFDCGSYSPDGDLLAATRMTPDSSHIVVINLVTSDVDVLVASDAANYHCPEWSPAQDVIAVTAYSRDYRAARLALIDRATAVISYIPAGPGYNNALKWAPDGSHLAYQCTEFDGTPDNPRFYDHMEICLIRADGSNRRRLTRNQYFDSHPSW